MRAAFGLVGLLVTVGVLMLLMSKYMPVVMKSNQSATVQVNQIAGNDTETGLRASDSAVFQSLTTGGRLSGILVTRVVDAGAYQKYFGIQRNDTIIAAEYQGTRMDMKDMGSDQEMATAQISEAYQRQGSLVVLRDGKKLTLPDPSKSGETSLQNQIDAIK